jgi:UDP-N-acetylglucosamine--N-acetylmuramyl-(pentapeptide) pyrophosphoryl-undecaprenol N-acetylglucosamine transferase
MQRIILVGGGTAGHVEPALAVADWLLTNSENISCEFVGTKSGIEMDLVPAAGLKLHLITKSPLPRRFNIASLLWPYKFLISIIQALSIVRSADLIIGFGGYVSAPCYIAAKLKSVPIIIHEANAIPGWANKLGIKFADKTFIAFANTVKVGGKWGSADLAGMPIREEIFGISTLSKSERSGIWDATYRKLGLDRSNRTIFIFGGSLGAQSMNAAVALALPELLAGGFNVIHAVGQNNELPKSVSGYAPLSYITNMADMYIASDLVISRGGAVTCAEIDAANSYALIVPLPIGNGEQIANAQDLVEKGAAKICLNSDFTAEWLLSNIEGLALAADNWNIKRVAKTSPRAAEVIGKFILEKFSGRQR